MNFTREPIIETVITPREGCKLVVRNSKGNGQEDYYVDAVEVVSFGHSFFFRSSERPKSFLVPVSDYEVLELRETRMVLKNVSSDRSIKIGGGRDAPPRHREQQHDHHDRADRSAPQQESEEAPSSEQPAQANAPHPERTGDHRKRDRRRRGRRGGRDRDMRDRPVNPAEPVSSEEGSEQTEEPIHSSPEEVKAPSFISKLFPPPSTLIKETLGRYKPAEPLETHTSTEAPSDLVDPDDFVERPKSVDSDEEGNSSESEE